VTADPGAFTPPTITLARLLDCAADLAADDQYTAAIALLDLINEQAPSRTLTEYTALMQVLRDGTGLPDNHGPDRVSLTKLAEAIRCEVYDLLTRGPDVPATPGPETF
jgi:hypothetical protein